MTRIARSTVAVLVAVAALIGSTAAADAAPKAKAKVVKKAVAKKAVVKKVNPCAQPARPAIDPTGLVYLTTRTTASTNPRHADAVAEQWVNYRGPQVWFSSAKCGVITTWVYAWAGQPKPWI
jgi:hypothetical protein